MGRSLILIAITLSIFTFSRSAHAYCAGTNPEISDRRSDYYSVEQEFKRSTSVAVIVVLREAWLDENGKPTELHHPPLNANSQPPGLDAYMGAIYQARILRSFKGSPTGTLKLFSENSTGRFPMAVGTQYLIFASPGDFEHLPQMLTVDNCGNSAPLASAASTLQTVSHLSVAKSD